jgi:HPt (histidine-containing phosphotransfer) domain-containing protein
MLPMFIKTLQSHMQDLETSLERCGTIGIAKAGHKMKGALLNLGLNDSAVFARRIEEEGMADNQHFDYSELVIQLKNELQEIL